MVQMLWVFSLRYHSRKMSKIQDRCGNNPFLLREIGILKDEIDQYYAGHAEYVGPEVW